MTKVARTPGFQKLPGLHAPPVLWTLWALTGCPSGLRALWGGGWVGGGSPPPGTVHFSGSSQLGTSQAAERGPSFLGGLVCLEPLSQRAHWLWRVGMRLPRQDHPGVGVRPPRLACALMLVASWGGGAGGGTPGQRVQVWAAGGDACLCFRLADMAPSAQALCPSPTCTCVSAVGPPPGPAASLLCPHGGGASPGAPRPACPHGCPPGSGQWPSAPPAPRGDHSVLSRPTLLSSSTLGSVTYLSGFLEASLCVCPQVVLWMSFRK